LNGARKKGRKSLGERSQKKKKKGGRKRKDMHAGEKFHPETNWGRGVE